MSGLTTKELSKRTWADYVHFFSQGNGWDHCGCIAYHGLRAPKDVRLWAAKRDWALEVKKEMVANGRTRGILVYGDGEPVGWCQYGGPGEFASPESDSDAAWKVTCFCTIPPMRRRGVSVVALRAAVRSIARRGGREIEGRAIASVPPDHARILQLKLWRARLTQLIKEHGSEAAVVKRHQLAQPRVTVNVRGVGKVDAWNLTTATFVHSGSVAMFEAEGFEATKAIRRSNKLGIPQPSFVIMRKQL